MVYQTNCNEEAGAMMASSLRNAQLTSTDFDYRRQQIYQQLIQDNVQIVGLWIENAQLFTCTLLACLDAKVKVLLPPNLLPENQRWVMENADLLFTQEYLSCYATSQHVEHITSDIDKTNSTEICLKTSGSSGQAKIIKKTAQQMWKEAETLAQVLPFERGINITVLGSVSVQHLYGLTFRVFLALEMGWSLGGEQLHYPEYLIEQSYQSQQAIWISSPALLSRLNLENAALRQCNLIGIVSSGGVLPENVGNLIRTQLTIPVVEIYGSTETGAIAARQDNGLWQSLPHSQIGLDAQGALWVKSAWINQKEQTADAVEIYSNGFQLLGRIDRIVKLGDKRISLVAIEQDLLKHPWVRDCYIALHPTQQRPVAWIALNTTGIELLQQNQRKTLIDELKQFVGQYQEKLALPRFWRFCTQLPRNSQSKISRADFERVCLSQQDEIT
ncbi:MAG: AMP-binding protein [Pasteurella oralis]|uniref:AMP-binding enzyme n=1 Tax=Pasteurella oralis TaxID=1071947 RepID=UPI0026F6575A|nr:AMP-binding protein [Pasteurella oralis]